MSTYKLDIEDFQILQKASLDLPPGLTLITGPSNHGKSSIFKAFKQLIYNQPGSSFIRHQSNKAQIHLSLLNDDNNPQYSITYTKTKSGGKYSIDTPEGNQQFTKLGSSQLDQIKQFTHIDKQLDLNFWNQMDKPFLIHLSPKEQFDLLQQSPHTMTLNTIQQTITSDRKQFSQDLLKSQSQLELLQSQFTTIQEQHTHLQGIASVYQQLTNLETHNNHLQNLKQLLHTYDTITSDLKPLQDLITKLQNIPQLDHLETQLNTITALKTKFTHLQNTVYPINELQNTIQQTQTHIDQLTLFKQQYFPVCPVCNRPFTTKGDTQ